MNWRKLFSDKGVTTNYLSVGTIFGSMVSYIYLGEAVGFERTLSSFEKWEAEYARRGYRTISVDAFERRSRGESIDELILVKREPLEKPVSHTGLYREHYLGKSMILNIDESDGVVYGTVIFPSTELLAKSLHD